MFRALHVNPFFPEPCCAACAAWTGTSHPRLRWHPGQAILDIKQYRVAFVSSERVSLSDPNIESISDFMAKIGWLIAGNSSIHLEAAIAGVMPIYYELTRPDHIDYYGYVKHGVTHSAASATEVLELIERTRHGHTQNAEAIRYYSATYCTEWDGREGELVAECLQKLYLGEKLPVLQQALADTSGRH